MTAFRPFVAWFACLLLAGPLLASNTHPVDASASSAGSPRLVAAAPAPLVGAVDPTKRGDGLAKMITQVTGVAMSPLLGIGAVGAWDYFQTEDKTQLSWYAQPWFWLSSLLLVALVAAKDSLGAAVPPGWKKPLDVADAVENKVTALIATGAFVPVVVDQFSKFLASPDQKSAQLLQATGDMLPVAAIDWSPFLTIAIIPFAAVVFLAVWLLSHAINVLILISPWGGVDAALKAARTSVMGLLALTSFISPWVAATCSIVIIIVAVLLAGWAFRLTVFGSVFCWDFFTLRTFRHKVEDRTNKAFAGKRLTGVPHRTYGRLEIADDGTIRFAWREWLVGPRKEVPVPTKDTMIGKGIMYPVITQLENATEKPRHLLTFPPRYRGHEDDLQRLYRIPEVREVGLLKGWAWVKEALGFGRTERTGEASGVAA